MLKEFRAFIARGNVIDLAVGIIMGTAFTAIVSSLVNDVIMPPLGVLIGGIDFTNFFITLSGKGAETLSAAQATGSATLNYGVFFNAILKFVIVSFAVFILVKQVNRLQAMIKSEEAAAPPPPAAPSREELLLAEIRDLLKAGR